MKTNLEAKPTAAAMRAAKAIDKLLCENYGELSTGEASQIIDREFAELVEASERIHLCFSDPFNEGKEKSWCSGDHLNREAAILRLDSALAKLNAK